MATPTLWQSEFLVNSGTALTGTQSNNKVVALANGGFVVAWTESAAGAIGTTAGTDIIAKIYDAEGNVVRDSFRLNFNRSVDNEGDFDLAATHDGFAMVYMDEDISTPDQTSVYYERYGFTGLFQSGSNELIANETNAADDYSTPQLAVNLISTNDDAFVAYDENVGGAEDVIGRVIDQSGTLGAEFDAGRNFSTTFDRLGDVAVLSSGNFVTVYNEEDPGPTNSIEFRIVTPSGTSFAGPTTVVASGIEPQVASLSGGGFVVVYSVSNNVFAKVYTNTGFNVASVDVVNRSGLYNEPSVTGLPDGGFVVVFDNDTTGTLQARKYNADGTTDGLYFTVETGGSALGSPEVTATADGRIVFSWLTTSGNVGSSIWDPRDTTINPDDYGTTTANFLGTDVITTSVGGSEVLAGAQGDTILGQAGDDTIYSSGGGEFNGGGGDDSIVGGLGIFETLDGGAGNDTLDLTTFNGNYFVDLFTGGTNYIGESFVNFENLITGSGDDSINGSAGPSVIDSGAGDDTINVFSGTTVFAGDGNDSVYSDGSSSIDAGNGRDTVTGTGLSDTIVAGAGDDFVEAVGDTFARLGDGDDTLVTQGGNDTVEGNAGNDSIQTGGGSDYIEGREGADSIDAGAGDDTVFGGFGDDTILGGAGNDYLDFDPFWGIWSVGADLIEGGLGDDSIGSLGGDTIFGGLGNDVISAQTGWLHSIDAGADIDTLYLGGTGGELVGYSFDMTTGLTDRAGVIFLNFENAQMGVNDDEVFGTVGANNIVGLQGNDRLLGLDGDDTLVGDEGMDTLNGGDGNDSIEGGDGDDKVYAEAGNDTLDGGAGNDLLEGKIGDDSIVGGAGNDTLRASDGNDTVKGGDGDDVAFGGNQDDLMQGGLGNDTFDGSSGNDTIYGNDGDDVLVGETGVDTLYGGEGNDTMRGGGGDDYLDGWLGNDVMFGSAGEDTIYGWDGDDLLEGNQQADELYGEDGNDTLRGGDGYDTLGGGSGNDTLAGGNGNDLLNGGDGSDILRGNANADTFIFYFASESSVGASDLVDGVDGIGAAGGDVFDLSAIDPSSTLAGDQAFTFLGEQTTASGVSFGEGALWVENVGGQTYLNGLVDDDIFIDFQVRIADGAVVAADYTAADFIL